MPSPTHAQLAALAKALPWIAFKPGWIPGDMEVLHRCMDKVEIDDNGCWRWWSTLDKKGYGRVLMDGSCQPAHRVMFMALVGPIGAGLEIDHLCRVRNCVNPWHMEPVTHAENVMRGTSFSVVNAAKTHCIHGHKFTPENTVPWGPDGRHRRCRTCIRVRGRKASRVYRKKKAAAIAWSEAQEPGRTGKEE